MDKFKKYEEYTNEEFARLSYEEKEEIKGRYYLRKAGKFTLIGTVGIFAFVTIIKSFTTIPTGYVGVKTRFGQVQDTVIQEGLNFKMPYVEKIVKIDSKTQKCEYEMEASSKDLQKVSNIKVAVNYNVDKSKANTLYREIGKDFKGVIIEPAIYESVKQGMSQYTAEELIAKRSEVSNVIVTLLTDKLESRGIAITALNITDFSFSQEFDDVIEKKQVTEQQTQQAKYELEKTKVENEKKIENAKTEAEVMKQQNEQITEQTLKLKELENQSALIEKWNGQLPTTVTDDVLSILNK